MDENIKESLTAGETWTRGLFMLLFLIIYQIAEVVAVAVVLIQFVFVLFTREPNERLLELGDDLSDYIYQVWQYLTMNSEERPFPFAPWPHSGGSVVEAPVDEMDPSDDDSRKGA